MECIVAETDERLAELASLRFEQKLSWSECAEALHVSDRTLRNWRQKPEWGAVVCVFLRDLQAQAVPMAMAHLMSRILNDEKDATDAAKTILNIFKTARLEMVDRAEEVSRPPIVTDEQIKLMLIREQDSIELSMHEDGDDVTV